jgi:hypothetical protein
MGAPKSPTFTPAFSRRIELLPSAATMRSGRISNSPGAQKTFQQFREDDALCQFYARQVVGGQTPTQTAMDSGPRVPSQDDFTPVKEVIAHPHHGELLEFDCPTL